MKKIKFVVGLTVLMLSAVGCGDEVIVDGPLEPVTDMDLGVDVDTPDMAEEPDDQGMPDASEPDMTVIDPGPVPNEGWIGGACMTNAECDFDGAICDTAKPDGQCTQACERTCPDKDGNNTVTFCITDGGQGRCVSRCDYELFEGTGCRDGYECRIEERHNEPGTQQAVCVPEGSENPDATTACLQELDRLGVLWSPWSHTTEYDDGLACTIDDPIRVASPINGIEYRYYSQATSSTMPVACELAVALHKLGDVLKEYEIDTVLHIGTYNCRKIAGTSSISQHGYAKAIDIWGFETEDGTRMVLEEDWEHNTESFSNDTARILYEVGQRMHTDRIFNIVLTPNYNSAHDNHFHVDLSEGANFIGKSLPDYYIGDEHWERCPH